jgi:hypothetical protein
VVIWVISLFIFIHIFHAGEEFVANLKLKILDSIQLRRTCFYSADKVSEYLKILNDHWEV